MQKIRRIVFSRFADLQLQTKFFIILLLALMIVFAGSSIMSRVADQAYNEALYERTVQLLTLFSESIQNQLDGIGDASFSIIGDNVLQNSLSRMHRTKVGTVEWLRAQEEISKRVMNISLSRNDIASIKLRAVDDRNTEFNRIAPNQMIPPNLIDEKKEAALAAGGREIWVAEAALPKALFLVRNIREIENLTLDSIGFLAMRIDMGQIVATCSRALSEMDMPLLCAIRYNDICIYSDLEALNNLQLNDNSYYLYRENGADLFCVEYAPKGTDLHYLAALPYSSIVKSIRYSTYISTGIAVLASLIALFLGSLLMRSVLRHIQALLHKFELYAQGQKFSAGQNAYVNRHDEIGKLHQRFDQMALEHQRVVEDNYLQHQLLLEAQVKQLRAQIHPHFLYNTLESIYCLAIKDGNEDIAVMTGALGKLLRSTLHDYRNMITIKEDLLIAKEYLNIQLIRHREKLRIIYDIEDEYLDVRIPSMTIQPIVENSVRHGVEKMLDVCTIRLWCQKTGDMVELLISDDGPGMDEAMMKEINSDAAEKEHLGIGLLNIQKRLYLAYHDPRCRLKVYRENRNTVFVISLPGKEDHHDQDIAG